MRIGQRLLVLGGDHLAGFGELEIARAPVRGQADAGAMAAGICYHRAMFHDRTARRVLARASLLRQGEESSCLAEARCESGGFVG